MDNIDVWQILAIIFILVSIKLFFDHRKKEYDGPYKTHAGYENITVFKYDAFKAFTIELIPLLIIGLSTGQKFFDSTDPFNCWIGRVALILFALLIYHELLLPYVITKLPRW